ncbi:hypothetical protein D3C75_983270 [compost metagenome]
MVLVAPSEILVSHREGLSISGTVTLGVTGGFSVEAMSVTDLEVSSPPKLPWKMTGAFTSAATCALPVTTKVSAAFE